jgi:hypothetical protein
VVDVDIAAALILVISLGGGSATRGTGITHHLDLEGDSGNGCRREAQAP